MVCCNMPSAEKGWLQTMKAMEECTIEATITVDYAMALAAFTINPLIPGGKTARIVLDELLVAHKKYLPQFKKVIDQLEIDGVVLEEEIFNKLL